MSASRRSRRAESLRLRPVGVLRSTLKSRTRAPRQGNEGAPDAWLEIRPWAARALHRLQPGDEIIVYAGGQRYRYEVNGTRIIPPTQVDVMAPTSEPSVTLISCYPYLVDNKRIAVFAQLTQ